MGKLMKIVVKNNTKLKVLCYNTSLYANYK